MFQLVGGFKVKKRLCNNAVFLIEKQPYYYV